MKTKSGNVVAGGKIKSVAELKDLIHKNKTILIASVKSLPASQYQEIVKKLRGTAVVKVPKKNLILMAIDESKNESLNSLKEKIDDSVALLFSNKDSFELAADLVKSRIPAKAKPGQEAPFDIEIKAGMTNLVPGPAISELGSVGITTKVNQGKLEIIQDRVIVKHGKRISQEVADVMSKLDIKPFSIGFIPVCAFDIKEGKLYVNIKIDREETIKNLKESFSRALPFAVEIGYISDDTITFMLQKAERNAKALSKFGDSEEKVESNSPEENKPEEEN